MTCGSGQLFTVAEPIALYVLYIPVAESQRVDAVERRGRGAFPAAGAEDQRSAPGALRPHSDAVRLRVRHPDVGVLGAIYLRDEQQRSLQYSVS